jgi:hypothetical protein
MMRKDRAYVPCSEQEPLFDAIVCLSVDRIIFLVQTSVLSTSDHAFKIAQLQGVKQKLAIKKNKNLSCTSTLLTELGRNMG